MKKIFATLLFVALSAIAFAQDPVTWNYAVKVTSDSTANLVITAQMADGYHIYSQYTKGTEMPIEFKFDKSADYVLVGKVKELTKPHEEIDEFTKDVNRSFSGKAVFQQSIKRVSTSDFKVKGTIDYQYCQDGACNYGDAAMNFTVAGATVAPVVAEAQAADSTATADTTVAQTATDDAVIAETETPAEEEGDGLLSIFLGALLFGIATMFTPCVFPMIPMTVNFFMNGGPNKRKNRRQALFFGFSIVFLFAGLGAVLALCFGPDALYFIGTHWIPNIIFFVIFLVFSMSFFGLFEIKMPEKWINKSDEQADKGGLFAPFFIALTTVLVSFSCTGPILGAALVELTTSSTNRMVSLLTMLGFGIGFALPFTLLALFPGVLKKMKSGSWLNTVKVVFAFLELAFGLKFLQQADLYCGWGLLDREWYLALWIVIFAMLGFYLLGKLRFKGDDPVERLGVARIFLAILDLAFVVYMIPGLWGAPLKGISGFLPPMESQDFNLAKHSAVVASAANYDGLPADRKYVSEFEAPDGYQAFYDIDEAKAYAKKVGKPIFIDFTGKTCANCREMEHYVWSDEKVHEVLSSKFVMCALYADANLDLPESDWKTDEDGNPLKTLGKANRYYQQHKYHMTAQPYYVIIDENENILTKENYKYDRDVQKFLGFLNEGLTNFSK